MLACGDLEANGQNGSKIRISSSSNAGIVGRILLRRVVTTIIVITRKILHWQHAKFEGHIDNLVSVPPRKC